MFLSVNRQVSFAEILTIVIAVPVTYFTVLQIIDWYHRPISSKVLVQVESIAVTEVYDCLSILKLDQRVEVKSNVEPEEQIVEIHINSPQPLSYGVRSFILRKVEEIQAEYKGKLAIKVDFNTS